MANERERERLAEIAELIKRVWVVVTKLSLRDKVSFAPGKQNIRHAGPSLEGCQQPGQLVYNVLQRRLLVL